MSGRLLILILAALGLVGPTAVAPLASAHTCTWREGLGTWPPGEDCPIPCPDDGLDHWHTHMMTARRSDAEGVAYPGGIFDNLYDDFGLWWLYGDSCTSGPGSGAVNPCDDQPTHVYDMGNMVVVAEVSSGVSVGSTRVSVLDTNMEDCNGMGLGTFDGDYDLGVGGGFFGYGAWAMEPDCDYRLNVHGPNVLVNDLVFGQAVPFVVAENDQGGPTKVVDPTYGTTFCETDGIIAPCALGDPCPDPSDPTRDPDDCASSRFVGVGFTCGTGGADGGYWVILDATASTTGTITAF